MENLIKTFNTNKTHIEIDTINQKENGTTKDSNIFTYTIQLIHSKKNEIIANISITSFSKKELIEVERWFKSQIKKGD